MSTPSNKAGALEPDIEQPEPFVVHNIPGEDMTAALQAAIDLQYGLSFRSPVVHLLRLIHFSFLQSWPAARRL